MSVEQLALIQSLIKHHLRVCNEVWSEMAARVGEGEAIPP